MPPDRKPELTAPQAAAPAADPSTLTLLAAALGQLSEGVIVADAEGRITFVNEVAARLHGMRQLEVPPTEYAGAYHLFTEDGEPYASAELPLARAVLGGEQVEDARWRIRRPGGDEILVMGSARPVLAPNGERLGAVLTLHDETGRAAAAQRLLAQARDAEAARRDADDASRRLAFLAAASERLAGSLDYDRTIREVVELAVPTVADWAGFAVLDGTEHVRLTALRHTDPAKTQYVIDLAQRYPISADEPAGVALALRTGQEELLPEISDELLVAVARDEEHLRLLRGIGYRSLLTMPVLGRRGILGALTLGTGQSGRVFGDADVELARELARRAATAIEHARLFEEAEAARKEAERERARAADVLETMADAHFVLDADFRFVSANLAMERGVEMSRHELLGQSVWEKFPHTLGTIFEESYRQVVDEGVEVHFVGEYNDGQLALVPEVDAYPTAAGGVAVFWRDVGARVRAERELARSERRFRTLADTIPAIAWTSRPNGEIEWYNARWYEYTGATPGQPDEWSWQAWVDPTTLPDVLARWRTSVGTGAPFEVTLALRGADGTYRRFLTRATALRDAGGQVIQWVGTSTDVEAERATRAEVEAAEQRLRDVVEQAPVAVAVMEGPDHVYTVVSPRYARSPGLGRPLLGRSVREAFAEIASQGFIGTMDRVFETGEPYSAHEREVFLLPEGATEPVAHYFNVGYQPLRDVAGRVYAIASVAYDVTEHVRARREAEAARAEAERQRAAAEEANRAKSQFLSTMSHELRTPLNAIAGYVELLAMELRGPVTEPQRLDLERIRRANQHLMSLISDILNFARLEAGQVDLHIADVELADVVADIEPLIGPQLAAKGLAFSHDGCSTDTPESPHRVRADAEKLRQVLLNLLSNAVKFTEPGGRVSLVCRTDRDAGVVRLRVVDTGRGIPAGERGRIFEPFVQVDRHLTAASQQGVGLGLAISRELARGMGGDLTLESEVGRGSTFTITLPLARDT